MGDSPEPGRRRRGRIIVLVVASVFLVGGIAVDFTPTRGSGRTQRTRLCDVARSPTGAGSADEASALLFNAWQTGSCSAAGNIATRDAVQSLFATGWSSKFQLPSGCFVPDEVVTQIVPPPGGAQPGEEVCNSPNGAWELQFWAAPDNQGRFVVLGLRVFHGEKICRTIDPLSCDTALVIKEVPPACPSATFPCAKDAAGEAGFPIAWIPESPQYSTERGSNAIAAVDQLAWQYMESGHFDVYVQSGETKYFRIRTHPRLKLLRRFIWHGSLVEEWAGYPPVWDRRAPYNVTWLVQFQWSSHHHRYELEVYRSLKGDPDPPKREGVQFGEQTFSALRYASP